nr:MAG TPA: Bap31/Bap29 transmembrane region [Caudoviricetes sp.]
MPQRSLYLCGFLFVWLSLDTGQARIWRWLP